MFGVEAAYDEIKYFSISITISVVRSFFLVCVYETISPITQLSTNVSMYKFNNRIP